MDADIGKDLLSRNNVKNLLGFRNYYFCYFVITKIMKKLNSVCKRKLFKYFKGSIKKIWTTEIQYNFLLIYLINPTFSSKNAPPWTACLNNLTMSLAKWKHFRAVLRSPVRKYSAKHSHLHKSEILDPGSFQISGQLITGNWIRRVGT